MTTTTAWHALPPEEVATRLETGDRGLGAGEVAARQRRYGPNQRRWRSRSTSTRW